MGCSEIQCTPGQRGRGDWGIPPTHFSIPDSGFWDFGLYRGLAQV